MAKSLVRAMNHPEFVPDKDWKQWTWDNLPGSENYWVTDIDNVHRSRKGCVYIIEIKRKGQPVKTWQKNSLGLVAGALKACEGTVIEHEYLPFGSTHLKQFHGIVELIFEATWFDDGNVYWCRNGGDKILVSEQEVIDKLSFLDDCEECLGECPPYV